MVVSCHRYDKFSLPGFVRLIQFTRLLSFDVVVGLQGR